MSNDVFGDVSMDAIGAKISEMSSQISEAVKDYYVQWRLDSFEFGTCMMYGGYGALIGFAIIPGILLALCLIGFTCCGVIKGSMAACAQSSIGDVGAGSCFSGLQKCAANQGVLKLIPILTVLGFIGGMILYIV